MKEANPCQDRDDPTLILLPTGIFVICPPPRGPSLEPLHDGLCPPCLVFWIDGRCAGRNGMKGLASLASGVGSAERRISLLCGAVVGAGGRGETVSTLYARLVLYSARVVPQANIRLPEGRAEGVSYDVESDWPWRRGTTVWQSASGTYRRLSANRLAVAASPQHRRLQTRPCLNLASPSRRAIYYRCRLSRVGNVDTVPASPSESRAGGGLGTRHWKMF